jgi:hypothetical protein
MNGLCLGSGRSLPFLRLTDRKLQPGYILHASHLKDTVEAAVVNLVLPDPVLRRAIVTNQSVGSLSNPRLKIGIRLLRGLQQRDGHLRQRRFRLFDLAKVLGVTEWPYIAR